MAELAEKIDLSFQKTKKKHWNGFDLMILMCALLFQPKPRPEVAKPDANKLSLRPMKKRRRLQAVPTVRTKNRSQRTGDGGIRKTLRPGPPGGRLLQAAPREVARGTERGSPYPRPPRPARHPSPRPRRTAQRERPEAGGEKVPTPSENHTVPSLFHTVESMRT